jgi:hypothetical protein
LIVGRSAIDSLEGGSVADSIKGDGVVDAWGFGIRPLWDGTLAPWL